MIVTKGILVTLCCISVYFFLRLLNKHTDAYVVSSTLVALLLADASVFKIKPFMFSFTLLLAELYFLKTFSSKKSKIGLVIVSILWINMHGSYPLFICVFGLWILCQVLKTRKFDLKICLTFIVSILASLINPFGYKLVLFNLLHNSDSVMKVLILDWKAVDCKTSLGVLIFIGIALYLVILKLGKKFDLFAFLFSVAMLFMTLSSARHFLYFVVSMIYLAAVSNIEVNLSAKLVRFVSYLCLVIGLASSISLFNLSDYKSTYGFSFVDDETVSNIKKYYSEDDYNGLFLCSCFNSVLGDGIKTFSSGIYPLVSQRVQDEIYMCYYASANDIEKIVDYYGLTGFVVDKYSSFEGYTANSVLYQYLTSNSDYVCVVNTDTYSFFVEKSVFNKFH